MLHTTDMDFMLTVGGAECGVEWRFTARSLGDLDQHHRGRRRTGTTATQYVGRSVMAEPSALCGADWGSVRTMRLAMALTRTVILAALGVGTVVLSISSDPSSCPIDQTSAAVATAMSGQWVPPCG